MSDRKPHPEDRGILWWIIGSLIDKIEGRK